MSKVNCLIVDDEPLARKIIETYLSVIPGWHLITSCINAVEAYDALQNNHIDVMFLDIQMPVISGIDFLRSLQHIPLVVFTTAYSSYAATGFDLNAVDYVVKPITSARFMQAVEKVNVRLQAADKVTPSPPASHLFIRQDTRLVKVNYDEILFIEARRDFTSIHLREKKLLASMHLKALEAVLSPAHMLRVHRSYIVSLDAIQSINGNTIEIESHQIPVGASYKPELFRRLGL
jgi:two-component system LytT family response regulator